MFKVSITMLKFSSIKIIIFNIFLLQTLYSSAKSSSFDEINNTIRNHLYYQTYLRSHQSSLSEYVFSLSSHNPLATTWFLLVSTEYSLVNVFEEPSQEELFLKSVDNVAKYFAFNSDKPSDFLLDFFCNSVGSDQGLNVLLIIMEKSYDLCHQVLQSHVPFDKDEYIKNITSGNNAQKCLLENTFNYLLSSRKITQIEYDSIKSKFEQSKFLRQQQISDFLASL